MLSARERVCYDAAAIDPLHAKPTLCEVRETTSEIETRLDRNGFDRAAINARRSSPLACLTR